MAWRRTDTIKKHVSDDTDDSCNSAKMVRTNWVSASYFGPCKHRNCNMAVINSVGLKTCTFSEVSHQIHSSRADSRFAPSQWETALLCNDVSHWLGANLESTLTVAWKERPHMLFMWKYPCSLLWGQNEMADILQTIFWNAFLLDSDLCVLMDIYF